MIIWAIQVFVQLNHQGLEKGGELPLLFGGFILGHSRLDSKTLLLVCPMNQKLWYFLSCYVCHRLFGYL